MKYLLNCFQGRVVCRAVSTAKLGIRANIWAVMHPKGFSMAPAQQYTIKHENK